MSDETDRVRFEHFLLDMIEGRPEACAPALADDIVWHLPPFADPGLLTGHADVMEFVRVGSAPYYQPGSLRIEIHQLLVAGGNGSCRATLTGTTRRGLPYENAYAFFARIEADRLVEVWELMDTVHFQNQLRARPAD
jgi:ketosteroid isomerase-like protein